MKSYIFNIEYTKFQSATHTKISMTYGLNAGITKQPKTPSS